MKRVEGLCILVLLLGSPAAARADVPSVRELGIDPATLAPILGDSQMILVHKEREHAWTRDGDKSKRNVVFITSLKVVNAPPEKVREVAGAVADYSKFINEVKEVKEKSKGDERQFDFETELNMFVLTLGVDYTLAYKAEPNGDLTWRLIDGDVGEHAGRWEFFALPDGKTLLAYTNWQDFESIGFTVRTVLKAQPDLKLVIPVATAAVVMNGVARRAEGLPREAAKPESVTQTAPVVPTLNNGGAAIPLSTLRKLAEAGTIMLIHPTQWFRGKKGKPTDFSFMSAAAITDLPVEELRTLATSFERFPEFLEQVDTITRAPDRDGKRAYDFKLKIGVSIFTASLNYRLVYTDVSPLVVTYQGVSGDLEYVYGAWEFFDVGEGKSLILYTTGNKMGDDAPGLLKLGKNMANRDLIVGVSSTALTILNMMPWLAKQQAPREP